MFILDASGSVGSSNFQTMKTFVRDLVNEFDIGSSKVRVGVQKYSSGTNTEFHLNQYYDRNTVKSKVMGVVFTGGTTNTGRERERVGRGGGGGERERGGRGGRQTDRRTDRDTNRDRKRDRQSHRETQTQTDRQTDKQIQT